MLPRDAGEIGSLTVDELEDEFPLASVVACCFGGATAADEHSPHCPNYLEPVARAARDAREVPPVPLVKGGQADGS